MCILNKASNMAENKCNMDVRLRLPVCVIKTLKHHLTYSSSAGAMWRALYATAMIEIVF